VPAAPTTRRDRLARVALSGLAALAALACADPLAVAPAPAEATVALAGGLERRDLRFACGASECAAWLYLPAVPSSADAEGAAGSAAGPAAPARPPVVVMAHGFAGTRDVALPAFAERFAGEGVAALVFDYRGFGASGGGARQLVDPWSQLEDWRAALAFARRLDAVDGARAALWGSSLGAGHALITAADDGAVRALVLQAPLVDTSLEGEATYYGAGWVARLLLAAWRDLAASWTGRSHEIPAIAPAGGFGMIVDDAAFAAFERLVEPGSTYRNAVAARSILTFDEYNPATRAADVEAPALVLASRSDRFAPFAAAEAFVRQARAATLEELDGDHFDVYAGPAHAAAASRAASFLRSRLLDAAP
jgi:pimeloyl-ACP methyl ester carboxylesterase